jgi:AraC-like DNA-binding protein
MNALIFDKELLKIPLIEPNKELLMSFEGIAGVTLERLAKSQTYTRKVLNIIVAEINGEIPTIDTVAKHLAVSVRSLQEYLKTEGTSFIKLLNEVRKDIAINCLKGTNTSIAEIAYVLGFSETSAFNRAFKRWTNRTPSEFRVKIS